MMPIKQPILLFLATLLVVPGCASRIKTASETDRSTGATSCPISTARFDEIYDRSSGQFNQAILYKPRAFEEDHCFTLAPLLMIGTTSNADGTAHTDLEKVATASIRQFPVKVGRTPLSVLSYEFGLSSDEHLSADYWVDSDGYPVVIGLNNHRGPKDQLSILFVSSSLELEARDLYGPPLPGRRFSIERSIDKLPHTVVAGVFDDGPMPLGPYLYLNADSNQVMTLICRCSPAQVDEVVDTRYYELDVPTDCGKRLQNSGLPAHERFEINLAQHIRWPRD